MKSCVLNSAKSSVCQTTSAHCSNPVNVQRLEEAVRKRTGQAWGVRLERKAGTAPAPMTPNAVGNPIATQVKARPQDVLRGHPLLQRIVDVLDGRPLVIETGFGEAVAPPSTAVNVELDQEEEA